MRMGIHSSSIYRDSYLRKGYLNMKNVYMEFQQILDNQYSFNQRFPICNQSSFIDVLRPIFYDC